MRPVKRGKSVLKLKRSFWLILTVLTFIHNLVRQGFLSMISVALLYHVHRSSITLILWCTEWISGWKLPREKAWWEPLIEPNLLSNYPMWLLEQHARGFTVGGWIKWHQTGQHAKHVPHAEHTNTHRDYLHTRKHVEWHFYQQVPHSCEDTWLSELYLDFINWHFCPLFSFLLKTAEVWFDGSFSSLVIINRMLKWVNLGMKVHSWTWKQDYVKIIFQSF